MTQVICMRSSVMTHSHRVGQNKHTVYIYKSSMANFEEFLTWKFVWLEKNVKLSNKSVHQRVPFSGKICQAVKYKSFICTERYVLQWNSSLFICRYVWAKCYGTPDRNHTCTCYFFWQHKLLIMCNVCHKPLNFMEAFKMNIFYWATQYYHMYVHVCTMTGCWHRYSDCVLHAAQERDKTARSYNAWWLKCTDNGQPDAAILLDSVSWSLWIIRYCSSLMALTDPVLRPHIAVLVLPVWYTSTYFYSAPHCSQCGALY